MPDVSLEIVVLCSCWLSMLVILWTVQDARLNRLRIERDFWRHLARTQGLVSSKANLEHLRN